MKRVLIFGSNGQIAKSVKTRLQKFEVKTVGRGYCGNQLAPYTRKFAEAAIREFEPELILNAAGLISANTSEALRMANIAWPVELMEASLAAKRAARVVLLGSAAEYGLPDKNPISEASGLNPVSEYGRFKVEQFDRARFFRSKGLAVDYIRVFNFLSPQMSSELAFGNWLRQVRSHPQGGVIETFGLDSIRDFLDLRDVGDAIARFVECGLEEDPSGSSEWVYNLCSGRPVAMRDLLSMLLRATGQKYQVNVDAGSVSARNQATEVVGDPSRLFRRTGFFPRYTLEQSVQWCLSGDRD